MDEQPGAGLGVGGWGRHREGRRSPSPPPHDDLEAAPSAALINSLFGIELAFLFCLSSHNRTSGMTS